MGNDLNNVISMNKLADVDTKVWVVLKGPSGSFLGEAHPHKQTDFASDHDLDHDLNEYWHKEWKSYMIERVSGGGVIVLNPAFEFITPLRPVQDPQDPRKQILTRDPVLVSPDFVMSPIPVYIKAFLIYFLCDMQGKDAETYKNFVAQVTASSMKNRAANSGLVLPEVPFPKG